MSLWSRSVAKKRALNCEQMIHKEQTYQWTGHLLVWIKSMSLKCKYFSRESRYAMAGREGGAVQKGGDYAGQSIVSVEKYAPRTRGQYISARLCFLTQCS